MDTSSADIRKQRVLFTVIVTLLIVALVSDLSWIDIIIGAFSAPELSWEAVGALGFLFLPTGIPMIYGWITKKEIWATLLGILLILGFWVILILQTPTVAIRLESFLFWGRLAVIASAAGYFAAERMLPVAIPVPILLTVIWWSVFGTGRD